MTKKRGCSEGCFVVCGTIFFSILLLILGCLFLMWEANINYTKVYRQFLWDIIPEDDRGMVESVEMSILVVDTKIDIVLKDEVFAEEDVHRMMEDIAIRIDLLAEDAQIEGKSFNNNSIDISVEYKVLDENNEMITDYVWMGYGSLNGWFLPWKYSEYSNIYDGFLVDIVGEARNDNGGARLMYAPSPETRIEIIMYDNGRHVTEDEVYQIAKDIACRIDLLAEDAQVEGKEFNQDMIFLHVRYHTYDENYKGQTYKAEGAYDSEVGWVFLWENY